jgi:hypothetical protein
MTSWKRGNSNEDKGEDLMRKPEITEKVKGAALKAAGEIEQGVDNVIDKVTGKQDDWKGMDKPATRKKSSGSGSKSASRSSSARSAKSSK